MESTKLVVKSQRLPTGKQKKKNERKVNKAQRAYYLCRASRFGSQIRVQAVVSFGDYLSVTHTHKKKHTS